MAKLILPLFVALCLFGQDSPDPQVWLNQGIVAFKAGKYGEAVTAFKRAVAADPSAATPHLYLATAWMSQYVPGRDSEDNIYFARHAETEFARALSLDPNNRVALASLASLSYNEAQGISELDEKLRKLDEARSWYGRLARADPMSREAFYSLGVIAWAQSSPALVNARARLDMRPEDPGPLRDPGIRQEVITRYGARVEEGIASLNRALTIDPEYDDAMAYLNLLIRERADLRGTPEEYRRDVDEAAAWVSKALAIKKTRADASGAGTAPAATPQQIRIAGEVQSAKLVKQVNPEYPAQARLARIQGIVRFNVVIAKDGKVRDAQLVSGHPLLAPAAIEAIRQWSYQPTLLNGDPVEVITQVDVPFRLSN